MLYLILFQVEVYRLDFEAERESREKLAGMKDDLEKELQSLKKLQDAPKPKFGESSLHWI